jgi:hypothetical protein
MRKGSLKNHSKISFWFPAEMSDQMINHRMSSSEGHSTLFLTSLDFDTPEDADKSFNSRMSGQSTPNDTGEISAFPSAFQRFYVKIHVRYTKL